MTEVDLEPTHMMSDWYDLASRGPPSASREIVKNLRKVAKTSAQVCKNGQKMMDLKVFDQLVGLLDHPLTSLLRLMVVCEIVSKYSKNGDSEAYGHFFNGLKSLRPTCPACSLTLEIFSKKKIK